jgi:hypothetical protein
MSSRADDFDYSSTTVPEAALFVAADEPLLVFPSIAAAEQYLEVYDVDNGVYPAAYGPSGERFDVRSERRHVVIERSAERPDPSELKALLLRYLDARGLSADAEAPLEQLVAQVWTIESDFWQEHDPDGDRFGTSIPWWGCVGVLLALGAIVYAVMR